MNKSIDDILASQNILNKFLFENSKFTIYFFKYRTLQDTEKRKENYIKLFKNITIILKKQLN